MEIADTKKKKLIFISVVCNYNPIFIKKKKTDFFLYLLLYCNYISDIGIVK